MTHINKLLNKPQIKETNIEMTDKRLKQIHVLYMQSKQAHLSMDNFGNRRYWFHKGSKHMFMNITNKQRASVN